MKTRHSKMIKGDDGIEYVMDIIGGCKSCCFNRGNNCSVYYHQAFKNIYSCLDMSQKFHLGYFPNRSFKVYKPNKHEILNRWKKTFGGI